MRLPHWLEHARDLGLIEELGSKLEIHDKESFVTWLKREARARIARQRLYVEALAVGLLAKGHLGRSEVESILKGCSMEDTNG